MCYRTHKPTTYYIDTSGPPPLVCGAVCMPVFFPMGSSSQLIFGLMICFITFGVYGIILPYGDAGDNHLALVAQVSNVKRANTCTSYAS